MDDDDCIVARSSQAGPVADDGSFRVRVCLEDQCDLREQIVRLA
jgi:hypothetical protein